MDSDGQHEVKSVFESIEILIKKKKDLVLNSRFLNESSIIGLSKSRENSSNFANKIARLSLSNNYKFNYRYLSGCFSFKRNKCIEYIKI